MAATPPTTPPAIGPAGVEVDLWVAGEGLDDAVVEGVVESERDELLIDRCWVGGIMVQWKDALTCCCRLALSEECFDSVVVPLNG